MKRVSIIGAGFSGLAAAASAASAGFEVEVFEMHDRPGGRARQFERQGFRFDMGPSWYWMPDLIEAELNRYGVQTEDFFELSRLDPSYTVFWKAGPPLQVPARGQGLATWMESREAGSSERLKQFLREAGEKYRMGMHGLAQKARPGLTDLVNPSMIRRLFTTDLFTSMKKHIEKYFADRRIQALLSFPVLFLGGSPRQLPALYSLMNYADIELGSWYPQGGMYKLVEAWYRLARQLGARFHFNTEISELSIHTHSVRQIHTKNQSFTTDSLIATGDYHHIEQHLLPPEYRQYGKSYWDSRTLAPSCLIYYVGLNRKIPGLTHHNLFFDRNMDRHIDTIYENPSWPEDPLFYVCCPSKTDTGVAPKGMENLFILMPVAPGLSDTPSIHQYYFSLLEQRLKNQTGIRLSDHLLVQESYGPNDFRSDYHAFGGNAYGLANTLGQTSVFKPAMQHSIIDNMVYAGQLTQPGPGVPPCLLSGRMAAEQIANR